MSIATGMHYLYTVQPGDTLYGIANRFSSNPQSIAVVNHIYPPVTEPNLIFPGQLLVVPSTSGNNDTYYVAATGDTLSHIAGRFSTDYIFLTEMNPMIDDPDVIFAGQAIRVPAFVYIVEPSDSLYQIAQQFGIHPSMIIRANQDRPAFSPDVIWPGDALIIPTPATMHTG